MAEKEKTSNSSKQEMKPCVERGKKCEYLAIRGPASEPKEGKERAKDGPIVAYKILYADGNSKKVSPEEFQRKYKA